MVDRHTLWGYITHMQEDKNKKLHTRLNRIEGQVKAINRMVAEERDCIETVTQIAAVRSALAAVARDMLSSEAVVCAKSPDKKSEFDKLMKALFSLS